MISLNLLKYSNCGLSMYFSFWAINIHYRKVIKKDVDRDDYNLIEFKGENDNRMVVTEVDDYFNWNNGTEDYDYDDLLDFFWFW